MSYALTEVDLAAVPNGLECPAQHSGLGVVFRLHDRPIGFVMGAIHSVEISSQRAVLEFGGAAVAESAIAVAIELGDTTFGIAPDQAPLLPTLTIAICTKDRPVRLGRLLTSLRPVVEASPFAATTVLVIDNASETDETRQICEAYGDASYVFEPKAGLDFARNTAVQRASDGLLAFLDDDVVVDRGWLEGLARAWRSRPDAGGFTGLVLPFRLDTPAQIAFEERGGFGRGFHRREVHSVSFDNSLHPVGTGSLGAGCNMAFDRALLLTIGGFDDALDTGGPLPGGGDLDIFYRVLRANRTMVYEPGYLVFHEHRETLPQLQRQYYTWGLGFMAFLSKSRRHDPDLKLKHRAMMRWWFVDQLTGLLGAIRHGTRQDARFARAELWGGIVGFLGEYDRSLRRVEKIRQKHS